MTEFLALHNYMKGNSDMKELSSKGRKHLINRIFSCSS